jgi:hypothetical protein
LNPASLETATNTVFNRIVSLKDAWARIEKRDAAGQAAKG